MFEKTLAHGPPISITIPTHSAFAMPANLSLASPCMWTPVDESIQKMDNQDDHGDAPCSLASTPDTGDSSQMDGDAIDDTPTPFSRTERKEDMEAMYEYKLKICPTRAPHDWTQCSFAHDGEIARRRNPSTHSANPCVEFEKNGCCPRKERCPYAHGVWERGLHPQRYRTSLCSKGEECNRKICFFAHNAMQLRKPVSGHYSYSGYGYCEPTGTSRSARKKHRAAQEKNNTQKVEVVSSSYVVTENTDGNTEFSAPHLMSNNMTWAMWARDLQPEVNTQNQSKDKESVISAVKVEAGKKGQVVDEPPRLAKENSFVEREVKALNNFNTSWVDGLLDDESLGAAGKQRVTAQTNSLEWGRWILNMGQDKTTNVVDEEVKNSSAQLEAQTALKPTILVDPKDLDLIVETRKERKHSVSEDAVVTPTSPPAGPSNSHVDARVVSRGVGGSPVQSKELTPALFLGIHPSCLCGEAPMLCTEDNEEVPCAPTCG